MEHNNTAANWATLMNAVRKTLYCSLLILVILPVGCAPRPKIGLTDTVYFQLRQVLEKKLNAAAVDLVTDNSMKAYFNGIENGVIESSKIKILTYKPYDINIWKMYHWVDQYEGLQTTSGEQVPERKHTILDDYINDFRNKHERKSKPLVLATEEFLSPLINLKEVERETEKIDGLIIGGGHGVNPVLYGYSGEIPFRGYKTRDIIEIAFIYAALKQRKPVLGICRGAQVLAVALGGELTFDLTSVYKDIGDRHSRGEEPGNSEGHGIVVLEGSTLAKIMKLEPPGPHSIKINSYHEHAVTVPSELIRVEAYDSFNKTETDSNVIEGFVYSQPGQFAVGVQWHPERPIAGQNEEARMIFNPERFFPRPYDRALFDSFLQCAVKRASLPGNGIFSGD